ncbi:hypothetical protein LTR86_007545 [Recurvomyces mirabilis]|nr:hypothetical protein LTR86_007545 [Recurvomyces mirabilis]
MALDQQRNWDISMAQNLQKIMRLDDNTVAGQHRDDTAKSNNVDAESRTWNTEPIYLPDEIILQIIEYIANFRPYSQRTLASCCLLSHQWYSAAVPLLYERPVLYGNNFEPFLRAMCPSINLHIRKSVRAELVKSLNMANLVHQGSRSLTARLLDLSLVSESPPLPELFKTVSHLNELRSFRLPRSAGFGAHHATTDLPWPPNLEDLTLSGGIDGHFLVGVVAFPQTLRSITIEHCPQVKGFVLVHLLRTAIRPLRRLESLKIRHMPRLSARALDNVLFLLPQLKKLSVSVDYITPAVFDEDHFSMLAKEPYIIPSQTAHWSEAHQSFPLDLDTDDHDHEQTSPPPQQQHSLRTLELTSSGNPGVEDKITPIDVMIAIEEGTLPNLRQVRVTKSLHWHNSATAQDAEALADVLQERNKREWFEVRGLTIPEGEGEDGSGGRSLMEGEEKPWERSAGVWMFDG